MRTADPSGTTTAPDAAAAAAAAPEPASVPAAAVVPESRAAAVLASIIAFKNSYGLLIVALLAAVWVLYYNWTPCSYKPPAPEKAQLWEEKRRLAVERQQKALSQSATEQLKKAEEEKFRQRQLKEKRLQEKAERVGMQHKLAAGQRLGTKSAEPQTAAPPEDWLS